MATELDEARFRHSALRFGNISLSIGHNSETSPAEARLWTPILNRYRAPSRVRGAFELAITAVPLMALWAAAWLLYSFGFWWASLLLAIPASGFLVRLFMIQHDCGHGSFFPDKAVNDWVGRVIGVLTMTPYDFWRRTHAIHHATAGNLDRRGIGDVDTLTVREYMARSRWGRLKYRLYRHPLVMFGLGPAYLFLLQHRLPVGLMRAGWQPWISTQATNAAIAAIAIVLILLVGFKAFFLVHGPILLLSAALGVWLFYVQHQFEDTFWNESRGWDLHEAALHGSSYYDLPLWLRHPSRPPPAQPHPVLSAAARAARLSGASPDRPGHVAGELRLRAPDIMGRGATPAGVVPRGEGCSLKLRRLERSPGDDAGPRRTRRNRSRLPAADRCGRSPANNRAATRSAARAQQRHHSHRSRNAMVRRLNSCFIERPSA
jgi:omega-6 fatty acid desaturase (delta-12 desaturase)